MGRGAGAKSAILPQDKFIFELSFTIDLAYFIFTNLALSCTNNYYQGIRDQGVPLVVFVILISNDLMLWNLFCWLF